MKYLLTGGSGRLGTELQKLLDCEAPSSKKLNVLNLNKRHLHDDFDFGWSKIKAVIHAAAYTDVQKAETERKNAVDVNVLGTKNVVDFFSWCPIIYISTDYAYEGLDGNYRETAQPKPFNFYGFTKLAGEAFLDPNKDLIIRTSFKPTIWEHPRAFTDLYTSADYVDVIAKEIAFVIQSGVRGIINVGTERKSIFELAQRRNPQVQPCSIKDVSVRLPKDTSMNLDRLLELKGAK